MLVDLWLYRSDGSLLNSSTGLDVCAPCEWELAGSQDGGPQKATADLQAIVESMGGFANPTEAGFAIVAVGNVNTGNPDWVTLMAQAVNTC